MLPLSQVSTHDAWRETCLGQSSLRLSDYNHTLVPELIFLNGNKQPWWLSVRYWACSLNNFINFLHIYWYGEEKKKKKRTSVMWSWKVAGGSFCEETVIMNSFQNNITNQEKDKTLEQTTNTVNDTGGSDHYVKAARKKWKDLKNTAINKPQLSLCLSHWHTHTHMHWQDTHTYMCAHTDTETLTLQL